MANPIKNLGTHGGAADEVGFRGSNNREPNCAPPIFTAQVVSANPDELSGVDAVVADETADAASEIVNAEVGGAEVVCAEVVCAEVVNPEAELAAQPPPAMEPPIITANELLPWNEQADERAVELSVPNDRTDWLVWIFVRTKSLVSKLFGIASVVFLLAVAANVPIVQFLSLGYLLEVTGRLARKQRLRDAFIGLDKASVLGGMLLGAWLTLLPIRFLSGLWLEAYLIDPASLQTGALRIIQFGVTGIGLIHIASVLFCGGKLRYFFWPVIAPFSIAFWLLRKLAGIGGSRRILSFCLGWFSPGLVRAICEPKAIQDWFVPAICWNQVRSGDVYLNARDAVWNFVVGLNLNYYFWLGLKGFVGTFLWLLLPTALLVVASYNEGGLAISSGILGVLIGIPIFILIPFIQAHFARDGKLKRFLEVPQVVRNFGRAPFAHWVALAITLVLALPLFVLKIETIPSELLWTLSWIFVVFSWPARFAIGWAYRRGAIRERVSRWWIRFPVAALAVPVALAFALIFTLTRYVSWNGALSLFENHVFLLPAPFWSL